MNTIDVMELIETRTSVSLAEFAALEGITLRSAYHRRNAGTLGVETFQAASRSEIRVPIAEVRRLYGAL